MKKAGGERAMSTDGALRVRPTQHVPIVGDNSSNSSLANLKSSELFPTPESPTSSSLIRWSNANDPAGSSPITRARCRPSEQTVGLLPRRGKEWRRPAFSSSRSVCMESPINRCGKSGMSHQRLDET